MPAPTNAQAEANKSAKEMLSWASVDQLMQYVYFGQGTTCGNVKIQIKKCVSLL